MTRADEFTHFYNASAAHTFTVTYAACGDRDMARAATVDAYQRLWRNWAKMDGHELLPYVRTEAWKSASVRRGTRPLRKRDRDDAQRSEERRVGKEWRARGAAYPRNETERETRHEAGR